MDYFLSSETQQRSTDKSVKCGQKYHKVFEVRLERESGDEDWGFHVEGGWERGEWIKVSGLSESPSPVTRLGLGPSCPLRLGDFLVKLDDTLTLFMSDRDVETTLREKFAAQKTLVLQCERGAVAPMLNQMPGSPDCYARSSSDSSGRDQRKSNSRLTLVLDKERGIFAKK